MNQRDFYLKGELQNLERQLAFLRIDWLHRLRSEEFCDRKTLKSGEMTTVNNNNDCTGKAIKFHLPVLWSPWILCVLAPPLPLCFGDGGICVLVAALWQLLTCYRKRIITATCQVSWALKIWVLCQQKSFLSSIDLIRVFKDLLIVYFSLQNTKCIYLQARATLKDPAEMAVSTFWLLLLPFELNGRTTVTANTANAISHVELRLIRKSLDKSA